MSNFRHNPLLAFLVHMTQSVLLRQIAYLKAENQILRSRLPSLAPGAPTEPRCRFTHWRLADGAEVQVREVVTDRGWFASVERVAM